MKLCGFDIGLDQPFFLIAGPCVHRTACRWIVAGQLKEITASWAFHSSSKAASTRPTAPAAPASGPRHGKGLKILAKVKKTAAAARADRRAHRGPKWPRASRG